MKRKIVTLILALVLICSVSAVMLVGCGGNKDKDPVTPNPPAAKQTATTYVALDINPSVELILDENNKVMSVRGLNSDASVLLHGEDGIVDADVNVAVEKIGKLSTELKYVNDENKAVNVTVSTKAEGADADKNLESSISASLNKGTGFTLNIKTDGNYSLQREFEAFKAQYKENAEVAKMTIAEYRMVAEAMAADATLRAEEAIALSKAELIEIISDAREDAIDSALNILPEAEQATLKNLENAYDFAVERLETSAYLTVALREAPLGTALDWIKMSKHINYIVYKNIALSLEDVKEVIEVIQDKAEETVNSEELAAVMQALVDNNIISADAVEAEKAKIDTDKDTEYTLDEIEAYLDIKLKNATETVPEQLDTALDTALSNIEDRLDQAKEEMPAEAKAKLEGISAKITEEITSHIDMEKMASLKAQINQAISSAVDKVVKFDATNATVDAIENAADYADEQADFYEEEVEKSMAKTEGLLDKVDEYKASLTTNEKAVKAREALETAVKNATAKATAALEAEKAERKAA